MRSLLEEIRTRASNYMYRNDCMERYKLNIIFQGGLAISIGSGVGV